MLGDNRGDHGGFRYCMSTKVITRCWETIHSYKAHHERQTAMHAPQQPSCVIEELDERSDGSWEVLQPSKASSSGSLSSSSLRAEAPPAPATSGAQPATPADDLHDAVEHQSDDYHSCDDDDDTCVGVATVFLAQYLHRRATRDPLQAGHTPSGTQHQEDDAGQADLLTPEQRAVRGRVQSLPSAVVVKHCVCTANAGQGRSAQAAGQRGV